MRFPEVLEAQTRARVWVYVQTLIEQSREWGRLEVETELGLTRGAIARAKRREAEAASRALLTGGELIGALDALFAEAREFAGDARLEDAS